MAVEVYAFIDSCSIIDKGMHDVEVFLRDGWGFPQAARHKYNHVWRIFSQWRTSEESGKLRCTAGECLGVYTMFRHWVKIYARSPELATQRESLEAACACIDVIMRAKLGNISTGVAAEKLKDAIGVHLKAHVAAYGKDYIKPKHHWTWDVVVQLMRAP